MDNEAGSVETVETVAAPVAEKPAKAPKAKAKKKAPKAKAKKPAKVAAKGPGRPAVFTGNVKKHIVSVIKKHGLTGGRQVLAEEGTSISMPTLGKFAAEAGIKLQRGRPAA